MVGDAVSTAPEVILLELAHHFHEAHRVCDFPSDSQIAMLEGCHQAVSFEWVPNRGLCSGPGLEQVALLLGHMAQ